MRENERKILKLEKWEIPISIYNAGLYIIELQFDDDGHRCSLMDAFWIL